MGASIASFARSFFDFPFPASDLASFKKSASTFSSAIRLASIASIATVAVSSSLRCESRLSVSCSATVPASVAAGTVSITRVNSTPYTCVQPSRSLRSFSLFFSFSDTPRSRPDAPPAGASSSSEPNPALSISAISRRVFRSSSRFTLRARLILSRHLEWLSKIRVKYGEFLGTAAK